MATTIDDDKLRELVKAALVDALQERRDMVKEIFTEALEDIGLVKAIDEGLSSGSITRDEVFQLLDKAQ